MMPNGPMGGPAGAPPMAPGGEGGQPDPKMIEGEIVKMLQEARRVAQQAGLDWDQLLMKVQRPSSPAPRMPAGGPPAPPGIG